MVFHAFFFGLTIPERDAFAQRAGTSRGLLTQIAYGNKQIELGIADVIVALAGGEVTHNDLPLTDKAKRQRAVRGDREDGVPSSVGRVVAPLADAPTAADHLAPDQSRPDHLWTGDRRSDANRPDRNEKPSSSARNERQSRPSERRSR